MIFQEKITFIPKETVYVRVDYTSFPKGRFFIMITIHPIVFNIIINFIILKIAMFVNLINKLLKIYKGIRLDIIYKFVKTIYFLTDVFKMATVLAATITMFFEPLL